MKAFIIGLAVPSVFLLVGAMIAIQLHNITFGVSRLEAIKLLDTCEQHLPRDRYCKLVIKAVEE